MAAVYNLRIDQGSSYTRDFRYVNQNISGHGVRCMFRRTATATGPPVFDSDDNSGSLFISDGASGQVRMNLSSDMTQALPAPWEGVYDIELTDGQGKVIRLLQGLVTINPNTTRDDT
jgi:hypothetical protein